MNINNTHIFFAATILCHLGIVYAGKKKIFSLTGGAKDDESSKSSIFKASQPWPTTGNKNVLVCGGAGYIGTHTIVSLLSEGYDVTVVDNLVNANEEGLRRVKEITKTAPERIRFYNCDLCDYDELEKIFNDTNGNKFSSCIHFAGLKAVGESVQKPLLYYENNLVSTINLLKLMDKYGCHSLVFSSSATVYGSANVPITEETPAGTGITNAYGRTKYMIEEILRDFKRSKSSEITKKPDDWKMVVLRYFNPVGAHPSGRIGEDPNGIPNNLMPFVSQVVVGRRAKLTVFGNDYPTPDGTGVRDYIHVMDLAEGHCAALKYMEAGKGTGYGLFNLGTGKGNSVLEMIAAMKKASGKPLPYEFGKRREGDIAVCYASTDKAEKELGWKATRTLDNMCEDLWNWQSNNPNGFAK